MKSILTTILKLLVSLALFAWLLRHIDLQQLAAASRSLDIGDVAAAVLMLVLGTALAAWRWTLIMHRLGFALRLRDGLAIYFKGAFFNQALPGSVGGDAVRVLDVARQGYRHRDVLMAVLIDRIIGLSGLLLLNISANALSGGLLPLWLFHLINLICLGGFAGIAALALLPRIQWLTQLRYLGSIVRMTTGFAQVLHRGRDVLFQLLLSAAIHGFTIASLYLLSRAIHLDLSVSALLLIVPPVILLTLLPISLAGWGVREGAMVGLFTLLGAPRSGVLALSLWYGLSLILASLPGLLVLIRSRNSGAPNGAVPVSPADAASDTMPPRP